MCCECCSVTQRKVWVFGLGTLFIAFGVTLMLIWEGIAENIMHENLVLKEGSESYKNWIESPIPIYLEFYMFNWRNPEELHNPNVKPNLQEIGPYVYLEKQKKENITFYPNGTVSYYKRSTWFFDEKQSIGKESDLITAAHAITATVADQMRHKNKLIKKVINFLLNHEGGKLYTTKPVGEWIFKGYQDDLIDFLRMFNTSKIHMPYTKFAWLADRNNSLEYDGLFTIHTGVDDLYDLGKLTHWNGKNESGFYEAPCGTINGTTGDLFPPHIDTRQEMTIYTTDACRYMNLAPNGTIEHYGLEATNWEGTIETLDSGENYPNQQCFCNPKEEVCPKTGVIECRKCRDNAPIYASFPHFHLADPSYVNAVTGLHPNPDKHKFVLSVEPITGVPMQINGRLQINLLLEPDNDFDIYRGIPKVLMPMFWFNQKAILSKELTNRTKLAINLGSYGIYFAIALLSLGSILFITGIGLTITKSWKRVPANEDEDMLTVQ